MKTFPLKEAWEGAQAYMNEGFKIYQQFNCAKCRVKQTIDVPDRFFTRGKCEECGHITDLTKAGCNYMAIGRNVGPGEWPKHKPGT